MYKFNSTTDNNVGSPLSWFHVIIGAHILSGNVFEPRALDELLPEWKQEEVHFCSLCFLLCCLY